MAVNLPSKVSSSSHQAPLGGPEATASRGQTTNEKAKIDSTPALPPSAETVPVKAPVRSQASLVGRHGPAVAGAMLAMMLGSGCAVSGPRLDDPSFVAPPAYTMQVGSEYHVDPGAFSQAMDDLEQMRANGEVSMDDVSRVRAVLYRAFVLGERSGVAQDDRGRITITAVLDELRAPVADEAQSKGEIIMDQLSAQIERRMRITPRDMARGNFKAIEHLPGYKEIPAGDVQGLFEDAFKRMPIGELPFGAALVNALALVPGTNDLDVAALSFNQLERELKDDAKQVLKDHFGDFVDEHKIELGVVAFAAVTGLRASSPEAAKLMDQLSLKVRVWKSKTDDGNLRSSGRLVWRDQHILPDLDVTAQATRAIGDRTTLRASLDGTASLEADRYLTGTATVGAHYVDGDFWADASGQYDTDDKWRASLKSGYANPETSYRWTAALDSTFGDGVAVGDAPGRASATLDFGQELKFDRATGYWGAYVGASADTDMSNSRTEAGIVFSLRW